MDTPLPVETPKEEEMIKFKDNQGKIIDVKIFIQDNNICFQTVLIENEENNKKYLSIYSFDNIKRINKYFFLCENINDIYNQIISLSKENKSHFILDKNINRLFLTIQTDMILASEIKIELNEEGKNEPTILSETDNGIIKQEKTKEINLDELIKANKKMTDLINNLINENRDMKKAINSIKNNQAIIINKINYFKGYYEFDEKYLDIIKKWIDPLIKYKITFDLIYSYNTYGFDRYKSFERNCNIRGPALFIFITQKNSIFGSFCSCYTTLDLEWKSDPNAFIFSLNLNKKYPRLNTKNYQNGGNGYNFHDIEFEQIYFLKRFGLFKTGYYLNNYELEGKNDKFTVGEFLVFKVNIRL